MRRSGSILLLLLFVVSCGEPLVVSGDLPGFMRIVAGIPNTSGIGSDTLGITMRLTGPIGVAANDSGDVFIGDQSVKVVRVQSNGRAEVIHRGSRCFDPPENCLMRPQQMIVRSGDLYIADDMTDRVWRLNRATGALASYAGTGTTAFSPDGTPVAEASLVSPSGLAEAPDGRVFISESGSHRIRVVGGDGILRTFAGTGTPGRAGDGGRADAAQLSAPGWIVIADGVLYIADSGNHLIRAVDLATETISTVAGSGQRGFSGDNGPALGANLNLPWPLAVAPDGKNLFFGELGNHRVRVVGLETGGISTLAGTGSTGYSGNGRAAAETSINQPTGLAMTKEGYLFIADTGHNLVWRTPIRF